ncbi:hypothetical protein ACSFA0_25745 [Variovorax sp. LT1P1]|uniref:hypothetical protein n=1 Tax=Variovorax sp. LT1P1 TaxID=3443730 RepID=UPI003F4615FE
MNGRAEPSGGERLRDIDTKSTQKMIDETKAIQAETALMMAKFTHRLAEQHLRGSLVDRPWFPWVALLGAMAIGAGVVALLAR